MEIVNADFISHIVAYVIFSLLAAILFWSTHWEFSNISAMKKALQAYAERFTPSWLKPYVLAQYLSRSHLIEARKNAETKRVTNKSPHVIHFFHQVDDPYSSVALQALLKLHKKFQIEVKTHLTGKPLSEFVPEREMLVKYSQKDAELLAWRYNLLFRDPGHIPTAGIICSALESAVTLQASALPTYEYLERLSRITDELIWQKLSLPAVVEANTPQQLSPAIEEQLHNSEKFRDEKGHYLGATFFYEGEWYWGVDRMHHLEQRLVDLNARRIEEVGIDNASQLSSSVMFPCLDSLDISKQQRLSMPMISLTDSNFAQMKCAELIDALKADQRPELNFFFSFRSPYSSIAVDRVFALAKRLNVNLKLRYVLPMVMRGLPVPIEKRTYIITDVAREAFVRGISFGKMFDPVGRPVERLLCLMPLAEQCGLQERFVSCAMKAVWSEGVDVGRDAGLKKVTDATGLVWSQCQDALQEIDTGSWREIAERNRKDLFKCGHWGVPTFQVCKLL